MVGSIFENIPRIFFKVIILTEPLTFSVTELLHVFKTGLL